MQVSSELPLSAGSVPALSSPHQRAQRQSAKREYVGDEEFPADLPVEYDRLLQPVSGHAFRWTTSLLLATFALLLSGLSFWGFHKFPKVTIGLGVALATVAIAKAFRVAFSRLGANSEPAWRDLPRPNFHLKS
jgi:hypothetical protein